MENYIEKIVVSKNEYQVMTEISVRMDMVKEVIKFDRYYQNKEISAYGLTSDTTEMICRLLGIEIPDKKEAE